jgi:hypothetical protein
MQSLGEPVEINFLCFGQSQGNQNRIMRRHFNSATKINKKSLGNISNEN